MTQIDITFSKFNLFLILNHHMIAYGARNHIHIYIVTLEGQEKKVAPEPPQQKKSTSFGTLRP